MLIACSPMRIAHECLLCTSNIGSNIRLWQGIATLCTANFIIRAPTPLTGQVSLAFLISSRSINASAPAGALTLARKNRNWLDILLTAPPPVDNQIILRDACDYNRAVHISIVRRRNSRTMTVLDHARLKRGCLSRRAGVRN